MLERVLVKGLVEAFLLDYIVVLVLELETVMVKE